MAIHAVINVLVSAALCEKLHTVPLLGRSLIYGQFLIGILNSADFYGKFLERKVENL